MSIWLINDQTLAARSVTSAKLTFKNAISDEFSFTVSPSVVSSFAIDDDIVVKKDGVVVFRGVIRKPARVQTAPRYGFQFTALGAWSWYERTMPASSRARINADGSSSNLLTNEYVITGADALLGHLLYLSSLATGRVATGTINVPTFLPPSQTLDNVTVADCLLTMLKYVTRYWCWFDYSVNPPTFNMATAEQANYRTKTLAQNTSINVTPASSAVDRVEVYYERDCEVWTGITSGVNALLVPALIPSRGVRRVLTDKFPVSSPSTPGWINHLNQKVTLSGSDTIYRAIWTTQATWTLGQIIFNSSSVNFWSDAQRSAFVQFWADLGISTGVGPIHSGAGIQLQEVISDPLGIALTSCFLLRTGRPPDGLLYRADYPQGIHCARCLVNITVGTNAQIQSTCYVSGTPGVGAMKTRLISPSTDPAPVAGVAQMIYTDKNRSVYDGTVQARRDWETGLNNFGAINVASIPQTFAGVQQVEYVVETDAATITLGQLNTLSHDDMVATLRQGPRRTR